MSAQRSGNSAGIGVGGILVIIGIILAIIWSVWIGVIVALVGLIAFGGFARGKMVLTARLQIGVRPPIVQRAVILCSVISRRARPAASGSPRRGPCSHPLLD